MVSDIHLQREAAPCAQLHWLRNADAQAGDAELAWVVPHGCQGATSKIHRPLGALLEPGYPPAPPQAAPVGGPAQAQGLALGLVAGTSAPVGTQGRVQQCQANPTLHPWTRSPAGSAAGSLVALALDASPNSIQLPRGPL